MLIDDIRICVSSKRPQARSAEMSSIQIDNSSIIKIACRFEYWAGGVATVVTIIATEQ
jgi:hypothetical protein